jgi:hypothetical protein
MFLRLLYVSAQNIENDGCSERNHYEETHVSMSIIVNCEMHEVKFKKPYLWQNKHSLCSQNHV